MESDPNNARLPPHMMAAWWSTNVTTSRPVTVVNLATVTERELFSLWMLGYDVGAEIDRRGLGR